MNVLYLHQCLFLVHRFLKDELQFPQAPVCCGICFILTLSVTLGEWQVIRPNNSDVNLTTLTDGDDSHCQHISTTEAMLLKSMFISPVRGDIHVGLLAIPISCLARKYHEECVLKPVFADDTHVSHHRLGL